MILLDLYSKYHKDLDLFKNKQKIDLNLTKSLIKAPPKKNKLTLKESALLNIKKISNNTPKLKKIFYQL